MKTFTSESIAEIYEALKHNRTCLFKKGGEITDKIYLDAECNIIWRRRKSSTKNVYRLTDLTLVLKDNIKDCDDYSFSKDGNDRRKK